MSAGNGPDGQPLKTVHLQSSEWSQWPGLNRRPTVYETVALPLSYIGIFQIDRDASEPHHDPHRIIGFQRIEINEDCWK